MLFDGITPVFWSRLLREHRVGPSSIVINFFFRRTIACRALGSVRWHESCCYSRLSPPMTRVPFPNALQHAGTGTPSNSVKSGPSIIVSTLSPLLGADLARIPGPRMRARSALPGTGPRRSATAASLPRPAVLIHVRRHAIATITHAARPSPIVKTSPSNIVARLTRRPFQRRRRRAGL